MTETVSATCLQRVCILVKADSSEHDIPITPEPEIRTLKSK